ncbi:digestive organ expansion factor [Neolentinus lepideus HHB14362 ss-1]|uniref:U3 small nucleolar RNA-associated protein 25 n=1 Tax=Neolentinus lepideus HHB14362 ss-1 TaxID=1314782 RepID=A0A165QLC4_9AGAM|nr:digestive organ expansion factor [Neolentinus lepideus HHB14362 ss-1]
MDDGNSTTTRLLTLLNVSTTKSNSKRKWVEDDAEPLPKLNKRKSARFSDAEEVAGQGDKENKAGYREEAIDENGEVEEVTAGETDVGENDSNPFEEHFGIKPVSLTDKAREAVNQRSWRLSKEKLGSLGSAVVELSEGSEQTNNMSSRRIHILDGLKQPFEKRQAKLTKERRDLQADFLSVLSARKDVYMTRTSIDTQPSIRESTTLHVLDHVTRKRRRILKNNERLTHAVKSNLPPPEDVQDQGFTRPSVLILLPFRNSCMNWINALIAHTPRPDWQIDNYSRFASEYGLPEGAVDKLATADPGTYPRDHVEMFKGNVDDNFRLGVKITRRNLKLYSEFYGSDIILASPLGLRMAIEKEKSGDFLSSIELLIMDQMDALTMQNWEHVQFVFSHLNTLPKESHDADFSRIKPWYLDGHASYLRQTILFTPYETPETRSLYNGQLKNVSGRIRTERRWPPISVPEGIDSTFVRFDCAGPKDEPDKRFNHFTTQVLPGILKSAVQSANTVIFIPSSFDFIRVHNYFRKHADISFTVLSEYSSNQDISRARQAFFTGKKSFLLVSERFHFFRRYKIRGIRNLVFYAPPDHPQFYTEFLSYPFLDDGVDASDIICKVLYSKYDWFRLERIAGTEAAADLIKRDT